MDARGRDSVLRGPVADVPRDAPPARRPRWSAARGRRPLPHRLCLPRRRRGSRCPGARPADESRRRSHMQARRSAAGCSSCAARSRRRASLIRSGPRCRRAARHRPRFGGRSSRAPSWSSSGAATGWCSAASTCSAAPRRARDHPGRYGEPLRDNLGIPKDIPKAVALGLHGERAASIGRFNGERFAVMAGVGFDAAMIRDAGSLKERVGRLAYVLSGSQNLRLEPFDARIKIDGVNWYAGNATCILARKCRRAVRRRRGLRGRAPGRRLARVRGRDRRGSVAMVADDRPHRRRHGGEVAVRQAHEGRSRSRSS